MTREKKEDKPAMPGGGGIMKQLLKWLPRVFSFLLALLIWFVALAIGSKKGVPWNPDVWLFLVLLFIPLAIAWRFRRIGGTIYLAFAIFCLFAFVNTTLSFRLLLIIPSLIVGLLFWADALYKVKESRDDFAIATRHSGGNV